jgi:serine/threonine-protein kinase HipA
MRSGRVYYKDLLAGTIIETNDGEYVFQYDEQYVNDHSKDFITFTMPVTKAHYTNKSTLSFLQD